MTYLKCDKHHYNRFFLCFLAVCIFIVCTAYERSYSEEQLYAGMSTVNTISSPGNETFDIVEKEYSGFSVIKNTAARNSTAERQGGFRTAQDCAALNDLLLFSGTCVLFLLYFYRDFATSHCFIIAYIHSLDGMKP